MWHFGGRVRNWSKHDSTDLSLYQRYHVCGGFVMVWDVIWHSFGPIVSIEYCFKCHCLLLNCCWLFLSLYELCTHAAYIQHDKVQCPKAKIISNWFIKHDNKFNVIKWPPRLLELNQTKHLWNLMEWRSYHYYFSANKSMSTVWYHQANID